MSENQSLTPEQATKLLRYFDSRGFHLRGNLAGNEVFVANLLGVDKSELGTLLAPYVDQGNPNLPFNMAALEALSSPPLTLAQLKSILGHAEKLAHGRANATVGIGVLNELTGYTHEMTEWLRVLKDVAHPERSGAQVSLFLPELRNRVEAQEAAEEPKLLLTSEEIQRLRTRVDPDVGRQPPGKTKGFTEAFLKQDEVLGADWQKKLEGLYKVDKFNTTDRGSQIYDINMARILEMTGQGGSRSGGGRKY